MREIKFRAWDKENTIMLFFSFNDNTSDYPVEFPENNLSEDDKYVLMQYTGFQDKNGKEIYEGDIVTHIRQILALAGGYEDYIESGVIVFTDGEGAFMLQVGKYAVYFSPMDGESLEVIGNIYENPELLSKET